VACSFFNPTPCVALVNNWMAEVGGFFVPASLLIASGGASLNLYRASFQDNPGGGNLFSATGANTVLRLWSSIVDINQVRAFS
jgi:hypothetical protein